MENRQWNFTDKSDWPSGPWQNEPDKMQFTDEATGLPCLIVRNDSGALCGYVGIPAGHPAYAEHYDRVDFAVHGGLTFSGFCAGNPDEHSICHVPAEGEPDRVWWVGFDCGHCNDLMPKWDMHRSGEYRDIEYVKSECERLAAQVAQA